MRTLFVMFLSMLYSIASFAQQDSTLVSSKQNEYNRDSTLVQIKEAMVLMTATNPQVLGTGQYKVYPTTNTYTSLKLNTATGAISALQIGLGKDNPLEYLITSAVEPEGTIVGRYELYPTTNMYNFILLDTAFGIAYQVQWNTNPDKCLRLRFW